MAAGIAAAQVLTVGNQYVNVTVDQTSGQILHIFQRSPFGADLIYPGSPTTHTNFYMNVASAPRYFTDNNDGAFIVYDGKDTATYTPADSVYQVNDSIIAEWKNLYGYDVKQYTYPFLTATSGQIAIEYRVVQIDTNTLNLFRGILLELDVFSSGNNKCSTTGNDKSLVLDSYEYEARYAGGGGVCWSGVPKKYTGANVPVWWHAGAGFDNQNYPCGSCALATGKLRNPSVVGPRNGPVLVPPDEFDVGDWGNSLKNVVWNVNYPYLDSTGIYGDCAVILKWNASVSSTRSFRCCTSYGPNDFANDNYICNNAPFFIDLRFPDTLIQNGNGTFNPAYDTIQLWCTNVRINGNTDQNSVATLDTTGSCLVLAPGETLSKPVNQIGTNSNDILAWKTGYCTWLVRVDTMSCCKSGFGNIAFDSVKVGVTCAGYSTFNSTCEPVVRAATKNCHPDTLPPVSIRFNNSTGNYSWKVQDHRQWDTGIDTVIIALAQNFNVTYSPEPFAKCDTGTVVTVSGIVIDTAKQACMTVYIRDCAGNTDTINQCYPASPDKLPPVFKTIDSTVQSIGPSLCTENYRCKKIFVEDDPSRAPVSGLQSVTVTGNVNYGTTMHRGVSKDTVDACVIDSMYNASLSLLATDTAGNNSSYSINYCTIQDTLPPVIVGGNNGTVYSYVITEHRPWDRGLLDVTNIQTTNFNVSPVTYQGDTSATIQFSVIDTSKDGSFCFTARDSFFVNQSDNIRFGGDSNNHQTTLCGEYSSGVDTLPPEVSITQDPLNNAQATVTAWDKHWINGVLYTRDKKLSSVDMTNVANIDTTFKPVIRTCEDDSVDYLVRVADTLSLFDTAACFTVSATDCQGLHSPQAQWCYHVIPDTVPPKLMFTMGNTRDTVHFHTTDSTTYDRGLASVVLDSLVNVDPYSDTLLNRAPANDFVLHITDTTKPAHARVTVKDMYSTVHPALLAAQTTSINFDSYVVPVWLDPLTVVENGTLFSIPVHITIGPGNMQVRTVDFNISFPDSNITLQGAVGANGSITASTTDKGSAGGIHTFEIRFTGNGQINPATQVLGDLVFVAAQERDIASATVWIDSNSVSYNDYKTDSIAFRNGIEPRLAPFAAITENANVTISGQCQQVLVLHSGAGLSLDQNVPNPLTNTTSITYSLDRAGAMKL
ncbi:MAG TPA: hypothetical protein VFA55_08265, partial [Candidatus Kapabacteria bacterium]|nr:hypothetical protein [Candidatus Kapabacteria bacterium]